MSAPAVAVHRGRRLYLVAAIVDLSVAVVVLSIAAYFSQSRMNPPVFVVTVPITLGPPVTIEVSQALIFKAVAVVIHTI